MKKIFLLLLLVLFPLAAPVSAYTLAGPCTSPYGWRIHPIYGYPQGHAGIDVAVDMDTVVPSVTSGTVTNYWGNQDPGGYGIVVAVEADNGSGTMLYAHLDDVLVQPGDHVSAGDAIALSGNSGGSTGPHLHIGYAPYGLNFSDWDDPMIMLSGCGFYNIDGDTSANTIGSVVGGYVQQIVPQIDMDFSTYFSPSETLENTGRKMLEMIVPAFDLAEQHLMGLLYALACIDLAVFIGKNYLAKQYLNPMDILLRFMRYSFFFFLFASWHTIISDFFIPMLEGLSTAFSGTTFSESDFLHFDTLFIAVSHYISPFLHVDMRFGFFGALYVSFLILLTLAFTLVLTFYLMYKLVIFYIMCVFGVLGIPMLMFTKTHRNGAALISSILCTLFDLVLTAFLYTFVCGEMTSSEPLDGSTISSLVLFTAVWGFLVFMFPKFSSDAMRTFSSLWDGWTSRPMRS